MRGVALTAAGVLFVCSRPRVGQVGRGPLMNTPGPRPRAVDPALIQAVLIVLSLPVLRREARRQRFPQLLWWLLAAQQLRFFCAGAHHRVVETTYAGSTDVDEYHAAGQAIAVELRARRLAQAATVMRTVPWETGLSGPVGTNLMRLLNGIVYAVIGPSRRGAFVVFSWLGFWGLFFFARAFAIAVPTGHDRTYLRLLFLTPSLAFETSTIGKEPWMVASLGVTALGAARFVTGSPRRGASLAAVGGAAAALMRAQVGGRLGFTLGRELRNAGARAAIGGSRFVPPIVGSPRDVPIVAASVLFRPHLFEAHNAQARAAAAEGAFLVVLSVAHAPRAAAATMVLHRQPYVAFAASCTALLVAYLSRVANFGMLVRQRVSALPFYFVLLSISPDR